MTLTIQKFGHACLLVGSGDARLLFDPGSFSQGFEGLEGLTAILVTHQHADHLDHDRLPALLERNPQATLVADGESAEQLRDRHGVEVTVASPGDRLDLGCDIVVGGGVHAEIHPDIPRIANVGYLVDGRLWHPGDALVAPDAGVVGEVEVLALPAAAPWMRVSEAIDFYRSVRPRYAVPIHEAVTSVPALFYGMFDNLGPDGSTLRVVDDGVPATF